MQTQQYPIDSPALAYSQTDASMIPIVSRSVGSWRVSLHRRPFSSEELAHAYNDSAKRWRHKLDRLGIDNAYARLVQAAQLHSPGVFAKPDARVLDCGVGTGALSAAFAGEQPRPFKLDAVDVSTAMLEQAGLQLAKSGIKPDLHLADVRSLPFADNTFDVVMAAHVLEHLAEPTLAIAEIRRVLKPGGVVLLSCTRRSALGIAIQLKWRTHAVTPKLLSGWLGDCGFERIDCLAAGHRALFNRLSIAFVANATQTIAA